MAKPGSREARAISSGVVDLRRASQSDEQAARVQEAIECSVGMRCSGCKRRIGIGFHFTSIDPRSEEPVVKLAACTRDDCDFAEKARDGATAIEAVEYVWLDPAGLNARAAQVEGVPRVVAG